MDRSPYEDRLVEKAAPKERPSEEAKPSARERFINLRLRDKEGFYYEIYLAKTWKLVPSPLYAEKWVWLHRPLGCPAVEPAPRAEAGIWLTVGMRNHSASGGL